MHIQCIVVQSLGSECLAEMIVRRKLDLHKETFSICVQDYWEYIFVFGYF